MKLEQTGLLMVSEDSLVHQVTLNFVAVISCRLWQSKLNNHPGNTDAHHRMHRLDHFRPSLRQNIAHLIDLR